MARNLMAPSRFGGSLFGGDPFLSLHREMNRLFDDFFRGAGGGSIGPGEVGNIVSTQMNVSETDKEVRITAELPGVNEQDVEVTLDDDMLTIRGEKKFERRDEKENFHFVERSFGTFQRTIRLPFTANPDQVQARFDHGVLTVTVPKVKGQEHTRRIQVQGESQAPGAKSKGSGGQSGSSPATGGAAPGT
jgi:HSP20 family protein